MNKKVIGLLLTAVIFTGAGSFGTYAYFTAQATLQDKIYIEMGKLDISAIWTDVWKAKNGSKSEAIDGGKTLSFKNVENGDHFTRSVSIENKGTLSGKINIKVQSPIKGINISVKNIDSSVKYTKISNTEYVIENFPKGANIKFELVAKLENEVQNPPRDIISSDGFKNFVIVNAEQLK